MRHINGERDGIWPFISQTCVTFWLRALLMQTVPAMSRARARAGACDNRGALRHFDLTEGYLSLSLVKRTDRRLHACACVSTRAATATLQRRTQHFTNSELAISSDTRVSLRERTWEGWIRPRQCPGFAHLPTIGGHETEHRLDSHNFHSFNFIRFSILILSILITDDPFVSH